MLNSENRLTDLHICFNIAQLNEQSHKHNIEKKNQVFYYHGHCHQKIIQMHFATIQGQIYSSNGQGSTWGTTMVYTEGQYFRNCWQLRTTCSVLLSKYWHKYKQITVPYPAVFGGAGFLMSVARRKTVAQLGSLGQCWKPSPVGSRGKTLEIFGYFAFWIAQNIALLALQQGTLTKTYTRNQHFSAIGGLSLESQTSIPASKWLWIQHWIRVLW